jgi:hypothetical protein
MFYSNIYKANVIPLILILIGFAIMISIQILQFNPLRIGGIIFWMTSIATCFINQENGLLVYSLAIALGYILPGILLWKKFITQQ